MGMRRYETERPFAAPFGTLGLISITVNTTPVGISVSSIVNGASRAFVATIGGAVNWGFATNVATNLGLPLPTNTIIEVEGLEKIQALRFVRTSGTDGTVVFQFVIDR